MIDEDGGVSEIIQADVTNEESCKNVVAKTVELWGAVHILVNIGTLMKAEEVTVQRCVLKQIIQSALAVLLAMRRRSTWMLGSGTSRST